MVMAQAKRARQATELFALLRRSRESRARPFRRGSPKYPTEFRGRSRVVVKPRRAQDVVTSSARAYAEVIRQPPPSILHPRSTNLPHARNSLFALLRH